MSLKGQANSFHPVLQYNYRNVATHSKYLKHFSIFKMTCFDKETMTSISNTTSKLCLITPGVCVCVGGGGGGGGGGATYFALKTFSKSHKFPWRFFAPSDHTYKPLAEKSRDCKDSDCQSM